MPDTHHPKTQPDPKEQAARANLKAKKRKQLQDKEVASKTIEKGVIIVNTGAGKGKSTAAFGLAVRALGQQMEVAIIQFIKGAWQTGEAKLFAELANGSSHKVAFFAMGEGFTWETQNRLRDIKVAETAWAKAADLIKNASANQLIILDELNILLRYGYLDTKKVLEVLKHKPKMLHIAITGRAASQELMDLADTVTEMKPIKHHYKSGVKAQKGIEF